MTTTEWQRDLMRAYFGPELAARIDATMRDFAEQMVKVADAINQTVLTSPEVRRLLGLPLRDEHHPAELPINGAAYHRRRNARRRRR
jgi:hypothetical protein